MRSFSLLAPYKILLRMSVGEAGCRIIVREAVRIAPGTGVPVKILDGSGQGRGKVAFQVLVSLFLKLSLSLSCLLSALGFLLYVHAVNSFLLLRC